MKCSLAVVGVLALAPSGAGPAAALEVVKANGAEVTRPGDEEFFPG